MLAQGDVLRRRTCTTFFAATIAMGLLVDSQERYSWRDNLTDLTERIRILNKNFFYRGNW